MKTVTFTFGDILGWADFNSAEEITLTVFHQVSKERRIIKTNARAFGATMALAINGEYGSDFMTHRLFHLAEPLQTALNDKTLRLIP